MLNQIHPKNKVMKKLQHNTEYKSSFNPLADNVCKKNIQNTSLLFNSKLWFPPLGDNGTCLMPQNHKDAASCLDIIKVTATG